MHTQNRNIIPIFTYNLAYVSVNSNFSVLIIRANHRPSIHTHNISCSDYTCLLKTSAISDNPRREIDKRNTFETFKFMRMLSSRFCGRKSPLLSLYIHVCIYIIMFL